MNIMIIKEKVMLNTYVFVSSSMNGSDVTAIDIRAEDQWNALTKTYKFFGGSKLKVEEFNALGQYTTICRMYEIFTELTGQTILYFAEREEGYYIDSLYTIDS